MNKPKKESAQSSADLENKLPAEETDGSIGAGKMGEVTHRGYAGGKLMGEIIGAEKVQGPKDGF